MPSLVATFTGLALIVHASAHVSLINIYGSNNVIGHAFGVNLYGKYPRTSGLPGDAGGDAGVFQTGTDNPSPTCGHTPELGPIDIPAWLDQSEGSGLPAAYTNMSVVFEVFQVNRDGGGPMSCQYSEDATATSWKPMNMILNQAGNYGLQNQVRTNETVVAQFPPNAQCTGGWTGTACIVRCLTGLNKRFGGCFAVKLSGSVSKQVLTIANGIVPTTTDAQINAIAERVISDLNKQGLVMAAGSSSKCPTSVRAINATDDASDAEDVEINALNAAGHQGANAPTSVANPTNVSTFDASDLDVREANNNTIADAASKEPTAVAPNPPANVIANNDISGTVAPASSTSARIMKAFRLVPMALSALFR